MFACVHPIFASDKQSAPKNTTQQNTPAKQAQTTQDTLKATPSKQDTLKAAPSPSDVLKTVRSGQDTLKATPSKQDTLKAVQDTLNATQADSLPKADPNHPPADWVTPSGDSTQVLDDFEYPQALGSYPEGIWEGRSGFFYSKTPKDEVYYKIQKEDDNLYLAAQTKGEAVNFGREAVISFRGRKSNANLRLHKKLRWRWRVHSLPSGSDERDGDTNDSAAAVRLVFGTNPLSGKSLKYIWSETLPVGTVIKSKGQYAVVLRSGKKDLGKWVWEEVNAYEDYRSLFGGDPRAVDLLGLLTDSNNTKSFVKADYDDITFIIPRPSDVKMVPDFMLDNPDK